MSDAHAIGCSHCEDDVPAPTGARIRGWFTGVAAAFVVVACGIAWFSAMPGWSAPIFRGAGGIGSVFPAKRSWQSIKR